LERLKAVSLFSGCGGMDLGLVGGFKYLNKVYRKHPVDIKYVMDNDENAVRIYNENFEHKCQNKDIREIDINEIPEHNILIGGFPCQSFSIIAQNPPRLGFKDERGKLFFEMNKILKLKQPDVFVAENVKGLLSVNNKETFPLILKHFEESGYHIKYKVLNSSDYLIPQRRERIFIIGFKNYNNFIHFEFPEQLSHEKDEKISLSTALEDNIDEKYYFSEKAVKGMLKAREKMNKGRVQDITKPCNTINAHLAKVTLNGTDPVLKIGERYRRFTPREAARIQSFPEKFKFILSEFQQYKVIGNAVPPVLMWHVVHSILDAINKTKVKRLTMVA